MATLFVGCCRMCLTILWGWRLKCEGQQIKTKYESKVTASRNMIIKKALNYCVSLDKEYEFMYFYSK